MYRNRSVAVVIPAHNEEPHIAKVIEDIPAFVDRVIVVDDASTDRTAEVVAASSRPNLELVRRSDNGGMGSAIVEGFRRALSDGADVVAVMDGDGQMDTAYLGALLDPVVDGAADFAKGNRFFSRHSFPGMPRHRILGNVVLSLLTKAASGYWHVFDSENGYTAISGETLRRLPLEKLRTGYQFANRLLIHLSALGACVVDVPIPARYGEETSGIHAIRDGAMIVGELVSGFWMRVRTAYFRGGLSLPGGVLVGAALGIAAAIIGLAAAAVGAGGAWAGTAIFAGLGLGAADLVLFFVLDARQTRTPLRGEHVIVHLEPATTSSEGSPERTPLGR